MAQIDYDLTSSVYAVNIYHVVVVLIATYLIGANIYHYVREKRQERQQQKVAKFIANKTADLCIAFASNSALYAIAEKVFEDKVKECQCKNDNFGCSNSPHFSRYTRETETNR